VTRTARTTLVVVGAVLLCTLGLCGAGAVLVPRFFDAAGCRPRPPEVSGVQDDAARIQAAVPALGPVSRPHWRWREARAHTCPDLGPTDVYYEGFAVLAPDHATKLQSAHQWSPTGAPDVPPELSEHAPAAAAWRRSATFDAETRASVWLDPASATVYFRYLRG
jgi:hypothetical protein